jgi:hypothetical protein
MPASWVVGCLLALFAGAAFAGDDVWITTSAFLSLGAPVIHTGAILMALPSAALLVDQLTGRGGRNQALGLAAIVFVSAFSDFTYLVWFVGPACVMALLDAWTRRSGRGWRLLGLLVASAVAGVLIERIIRNGGGVSGYLNLVGPLSSVTLLADHLLMAWGRGDYALMGLAALIVALLLRSAFLVFQLLRRALRSSEWVELFLGGAVASALVAPLLLGLYADASHWRYFLIAFFLPLLWVALWIFHVIAGRTASIWAGSAAVLGAFSLVVAGGAVSGAAKALEPSALEACLDAEGRTEGLAEYWPAKLLMLNTSGRIHLVQVDRGGALYHWNYNGRWFAKRSDGTPARPDFIIMENLDPAKIETRFGTPARSIACGSTEVWLYDRPLELFVSDASYSGADLQANIGVVTGTARSIEASGGEGGIFTYGPHVELAPGTYQIRLRYSAIGSGHRWDLTQRSARFTIDEGDLADTGGEVREIALDLTTTQVLSEVEVRTFFAGSGALTLYGMDIAGQRD